MKGHRILHCIPTMKGGGAERQLCYLSAGLTQIGWEVHVALHSGGENMVRLKESGATIHQLESRGNYDPFLLYKLLRLADQIGPDLIQTWLTQMDLLGGATALVRDMPWILSERSSALGYPSTAKNLLRCRVARRAAAIVCNSTAGKLYWDPDGESEVPLYVIPNAIPVDEIDRTPPASVVLPESRGPAKVILYAGRFDRPKNVMNLVRALERVADQMQAVALLCGDGPLKSEVVRYVADRKLSKHVIVKGYEPNIWGLMKRADVFVSVSLIEGQPNAVLEAMASGCPLIVSNIPEHRDFLDDDAAVFVNPNDPAAIANAIVAALSDHAGSKMRANAAWERSKQWSTGIMAQEYERVYMGILGTRRDRIRVRVWTSH